MDDFHLEESELHIEPTGAPRSEETSAEEPQPYVAQRQSALSRRQIRRWLSAAATVCVLLAALSLILAQMPSARGMVAALFPTATPLPAGMGDLHVIHTVPWGALIVNGAPVHPRLGGGALDPKFTLARGRYALEYVAPPFPTMRCQISVPAASTDTCPVAPTFPGFAASNATRTLDLGDTLDRLGANQMAALLAAVQAALDHHISTTTVMPGERYLDAQERVVAATTTMRASFVYALNSGPGCVSLCQPTETVNSHPEVWALTAEVTPGWRYATTDGQTQIAFAPAAPTSVVSAQEQTITVEVDIDWEGGWHAAIPGLSQATWTGAALPDNAACLVMQVYMDRLFRLPSGSPLTMYPASVSADGCALDTGPNFSGPASVFLYQFGVVVAANSGAHTLLPDVAFASTRQQQLAQQLIDAASSTPVG